MRPLKERVSITLDPEIIEKVRERAERSDRSLSQYINLVLRSHLQRLEKNEQQQ